MGTQATLKSTPESLDVYVHVQTGRVWTKDEYDEKYGDYVPQEMSRLLDSKAKVYVDLSNEDGSIIGFSIHLSRSAMDFRYAVFGDGDKE